MATEDERLSQMLFESRELINMLADITKTRSNQDSRWALRVRDEIDTYRAERGWNPHGFGGEG